MRILVRIADLSELDSSDIEVSPGEGGKESENEGSGEKSGVHRRDTLETLGTREDGGKG